MSIEKIPVTEVGMDFFETAPQRFTAVQEIRATPEQVFDAFEDADAWPQWAGPIENVEWTSPKPFALGTTRVVSMSGGMVGWEVFIAWERGKRMAFCFTHVAKDNLESFAEDYQVEDLGGQGCRVTWTMAMAPKGFSRFVLPVFAPVMRLMLGRMLAKFGALVEARVATLDKAA